MQFVKATKDQATGRVALAGPPGSGKTYTALTLANAFADGGTVAVIDTERGTASKYADQFDFDALNLTKFDPRHLIEALNVAADHGYRAVVIDSLSHFWMGLNGMLELADAHASNGNSFSGWKHVRPIERSMIDAIAAYPGHVVACLRTKVAYEIQTNDRGKKEPVKLGQKPEQREGIEYEFDIVGELNDGTLTVTKSRAPTLTGSAVHHPGPDFAGEVLGWLRSGVVLPEAASYAEKVQADDTTVQALRDMATEVKRRGLYNAMVDGPDGKPVALGMLISQVGKRKASEEKGGGSAAA